MCQLRRPSGPRILWRRPYRNQQSSLCELPFDEVRTWGARIEAAGVAPCLDASWLVAVRALVVCGDDLSGVVVGHRKSCGD